MSGRTITDTCSECGADQSQWFGHQVNGVYDGVLYWSCGSCGHAWARDWTGFGRRQEVADNYVAAHNEGRATRVLEGS